MHNPGKKRERQSEPAAQRQARMHENTQIESQEATEKQTTEPTTLSQRIAELGVRLVELAKANESQKRVLTPR